MKSQALKYAQGLIRSCFIYTGVEGFSLSSSPPSSEEGHITACPNTTVTLTCTATQIGSMTWFEQDRQIDVFSVSDYESEQTRVVHDGPYTLTLVAVDNISMGGLAGDFVSTLEVTVDDIDNGTDITCATFRNTSQLLIYKPGKEKIHIHLHYYCYAFHLGLLSPPSNVMVVADDFKPYNLSIIISWEAPEYGLVDEYRIEINTTTQTISITTTSVVLEGEYNIPLEINISATNCAGSSAEVTEEINIGMDYI